MSLHPLVGHELVRSQLSEAVGNGRLPQVLLLTGPSGVGKQRLALWLGQLLLCQRPGAEPCGECPGCAKVLGLSHPDLHWFTPVQRPKAGDSDKQIDEAGELLEAAMAERRQNPLWTAPDGMALHGIASARLLQRQASLTSVEGGWRVFIIGHAERLVPQESSQEAANALLKLLEEPPTRSLFVLTTTEPGLVLPTIRSRAMPVRLGRIAPSLVEGFLRTTGKAAQAAASSGSIGAALSSTGEVEVKARAAATAFLEAVATPDRALAERLVRQGTWQARGEFTAFLDALVALLAARTKRAVGAQGHVSSEGTAALRGVEVVLEARQRAQGNVNPQLLLAVLADELAALEAA